MNVQPLPGPTGVQNSEPVIEAVCPTCHSTNCFVLVRSDTPPKNWMDFLDRQLKAVISGHWSGKTVAHLGGAVFVVATAVAAAVGLILLAYTAMGPYVAGSVGGATVVGFATHWLIRRRGGQPTSPADNTPPEPTAVAAPPTESA
ncbi:hypothetical protein ACFO5K_12730 [Nocardia halotolerans]|uniref:Uncharacterized protein n=1 Tax=Nocardia halotolerans TaxID=1755878 RepID=A0ABV8VI11_9NOCA